MSLDTKTSPSQDGVQALLTRLKEHPDERSRPADEIAEEFGLSPAFVRRVLERAEVPATAEIHPFLVSFSAVRGWFDKADGWLDEASVHPSAFVVTTTLCSELLIALVGWISGQRILGMEVQNGSFGDLTGGGWGLVVVVAVSHMLVFFKRAMVRHAIYGALISWVLCSFPLMFLAWLGASHDSELDRAGAALIIALSLFVSFSVYAAVGAACAISGGYVALLRQERREGRMSRHEMLQRLFELQARLDSDSVVDGGIGWDERPAFARLKRRMYLLAPIAGLALGLASHMVTAWRNNGAVPPVHLPAIVLATLDSTLLILWYAVMAGMAFVAGGGVQAAAVGALFISGRTASFLIPSGSQLALASISPHQQRYLLVFGLGSELVAIVFGIGGAVQRRALRELNLERNDRATVLAELLKIQWRLSGEAASTCVMVVDAVKSSEMKVAADPLAVEYSFREYQQWIAGVCKPLGGRVNSTAGDGAVISFPNCHDAFMAGKRLQSGIDGFNRTVNRLATPFRLRVGLHVGEVQGDVQKVQFTEVIDIAAHVQALSPVSGIAATDTVVSQLNVDEFVPLARQVDGHAVFLALDPSGA